MTIKSMFEYCMGDRVEPNADTAEELHGMRTAEVESLRRKADEIESMPLSEWVARGIHLHNSSDVIAGRLAKRGWTGVMYETSKPGWRIYDGGGELYSRFSRGGIASLRRHPPQLGAPPDRTPRSP